MAVQALGYLGISTQNIVEWSDFAARRLGLQLVDRGVSRRAFRMDDRRQRVIVDKERPDAERFFGWEVADAASFDAFAGKLEAAGVAVQREPAALVDQRFVRDLISFRDPAGNRLGVFHGPRLADTPFTPARFLAFRRSARRCAVNIGFVVSLVLVILAVLGVFIEIPLVSTYAFWFAVGAYILLAGSYRRL